MILSAIAFLQPLAEAALAPVEIQITNELQIKHAFQWMLVNSLILVGIGLAPLILAPLSEVYGRKPILIGSTISFIIWNTACGATRTLGQLLVLRLFSGFGVSIGDTIAGGLLGDLWPEDTRGGAYAVFMIAPLLGTAIAPILGAFISEAIGWRWIFWTTSITSVVVVCLAFFLLEETFFPVLQRKRSRKAAGTANNPPKGKTAARSFAHLMRSNLQRPIRMLFTQIIIQFLSVYMALLYGLLWLFLFIYPKLWRQQYQQSVQIASLNYISFGTGLAVGVGVAGNLSDRIHAGLKARHHGISKPEFRIPAMLLGTLLAPVGLIWWGWSGEARLHWIMPNIGSFLFAMGTYISATCISIYVIDTYTIYAASAISTNLVSRSLTAALFPLFAPSLFDKFGFGIGATILAVGSGCIGIIVTLILWFFGESLRSRSQYCVDLAQG